jgi:hypothetical protein
LLAGIVIRGKAFSAGFFFINPGMEVLRLQVRKKKHEITQVAFRINDDGRNAI